MPDVHDERLGLRNAPPKPVKGAGQQARTSARRLHQQARERLRLKVHTDDRGHCMKCGRKVWLRPSQAPSIPTIANIHEFVPKSLGGDDLDPANCITLCGDEGCHEAIQQRRVVIVACDQARLMRGPVEFIPGPHYRGKLDSKGVYVG